MARRSEKSKGAAHPCAGIVDLFSFQKTSIGVRYACVLLCALASSMQTGQLVAGYLFCNPNCPDASLPSLDLKSLRHMLSSS